MKNNGPVNAKGFAPRAPKFEGKCPDLKGHIYDASDARQSDQLLPRKLPSSLAGPKRMEKTFVSPSKRSLSQS